MRIAGASMIYTGLANLYTYFTIKKAVKEVTRAVQDTADAFNAELQAQAEAAAAAEAEMQEPEAEDAKTDMYF